MMDKQEDNSFSTCITYHIKENMNDNLKWLKNHNELCDILLVSGSKMVPAHSCVLASHSPVLGAILQARLAVKNDWSILSPLIISLDEEDSTQPNESVSYSKGSSEPSILELLISFIYGEVITVEKKRIQILINLSKLLGLSQHFTNTSQNEVQQINENPSLKSRNSQCEINDYISKHTCPQGKVSECNLSSKSSKHELHIFKKKSKTYLNGDEQRAKSLSIIKKKKALSSKMRFKLHSNFRKLKRKPRKFVSQNSVTSSSSLPSKMEIGIGPNDEKVFKITCLPEDKNPPSLLNDTELWFKNELQNDLEVKDDKGEEKITNAAFVLSEREGHFQSVENKVITGSENCAPMTLNRKTRAGTVCPVCRSSFHRVSDLIKHVKTDDHYTEVCPLCFLQLSDYEEQKDHFEQHNNSLPFFCHCCDLRFRSRAGLAMHTPKHSDTKPYTCEECGRGFKWRHSAQAHTITHRNHCHLLCDVCGFSSKYMSTFQSHLKRHYDQYFPCPHPGCQFKSFRKTHLNDHIATHAKLRSHQCEVCGHSFSQAKNLRRHMRLHTPDTFFLKCDDYSNQGCPFRTTRPDKLRLHLIQKHNLQTHDKITLPALASPSQLTLEDGSSVTASNIMSKSVDKTAHTFDNNSVFKDLNFQNDEFRERDMFPSIDGIQQKDSEGNKKSNDILSSEISDILLSDRSAMIPPEERIESSSLCLPDSYGTYVIPSTSQENTVILSDTIEFNSQAIDGESQLVFVGNMEVLDNLPTEENSTSTEIREEPSFESNKTVSPDKIDDIISNFPLILQSNKNLTYLQENNVDIIEANPNPDYVGGNMEEFSIHRDLEMEDTNRTFQFIKLPDNSLTFLPHDQEDASVPMSSSSVNVEINDTEIKHDTFKTYDSNQFTLF